MFADWSLFLGYLTWAFSKDTVLMVVGTFVFAAGVNGNNTHAVRALVSSLADLEGIGKGEFSGWLNNVRTVSVSVFQLASATGGRAAWRGSSSTPGASG